jgi:hypothetical protein
LPGEGNHYSLAMKNIFILDVSNPNEKIVSLFSAQTIQLLAGSSASLVTRTAARLVAFQLPLGLR